MTQKIKECVFIGPQIRELISDQNFEEELNDIEKATWLQFKKVCAEFLGNHKAHNCVVIVKKTTYILQGHEMKCEHKNLFSRLLFALLPYKSWRRQ